MFQQENKALYNSLRMHWLTDPTIPVEKWQVEDYRTLPLENLLHRLSLFDIQLDRNSFVAFTENVDTPEELTEILIDNDEEKPEVRDQIYLLIFELWRRLVPEKPCLSVLCDELDHQISQYDNALMNTEEIQDILANLQDVLEENVDAGVDPIEAFDSISASCANDLESFLYDFIADRLDEENDSYSSDLLDAFEQYMDDSKHFELLSIRLQHLVDRVEDLPKLKKLVARALSDKDLIFNMDLLAFLINVSNLDLFIQTIKKTISLIETEEDFSDLLELGVDFCDFNGLTESEKEVQDLIQRRETKDPSAPIDHNDPDIESFLKILSKK